MASQAVFVNVFHHVWGYHHSQSMEWRAYTLLPVQPHFAKLLRDNTHAFDKILKPVNYHWL